MTRSRSYTPSNGGVSPQIIAVSVIAVIVAAVLVIFFLMGEKPPEPEPEPEVVNPFEGLPEEAPPEPRAK